MSSCDNVGVAEQRVSWIQNNADSVLPKELLRDQAEEQSFQCGFHPRILIVTNQAQQTSPSMISVMFVLIINSTLVTVWVCFPVKNHSVLHVCWISFTFISM